MNLNMRELFAVDMPGSEDAIKSTVDGEEITNVQGVEFYIAQDSSTGNNEDEGDKLEVGG